MKVRRVQHLNYLRDRVSHQGSLLTFIYAGQLYDSNRKKIIYPTLLSFSIKQMVKFPISKKHQLSLGGQFVTSNGFGDSNIKLRYTHSFSPLTSLSLTSTNGWNVSTMHARIWRQVTDTLAASVRCNLIGERGVKLTLDKDIDDEYKASAEVEWCEDPNVSVNLGKETEEGTFYSGGVSVSKKNAGINVAGGLQVTEKTSIGGSFDIKNKYIFESLEQFLSAFKFTLSGHVERSISDITKAMFHLLLLTMACIFLLVSQDFSKRTNYQFIYQAR